MMNITDKERSHIALFLKSARKALRLTEEQVAEKAGITVQEIIDVETEKKFDDILLAKLCNIYGIFLTNITNYGVSDEINNVIVNIVNTCRKECEKNVRSKIGAIIHSAFLNEKQVQEVVDRLLKENKEVYTKEEIYALCKEFNAYIISSIGLSAYTWKENQKC